MPFLPTRNRERITASDRTAMSETASVKVVVPIYRSALDEYELRSLRHNVSTLGPARFVLLLPEGLTPLPPQLSEPPFDHIARMQVSDEWLGVKNGILGYNRMMMSEAFYALFADTEYMLVCQTDVWLFRDELDAWCARGYDYIGGPYLRRGIYDMPPVRQWLALRRRWCGAEHVLRQDGWGRVLNGGLSLRRVAAFRHACLQYAEQIDRLGRVRSTVSNEDWFWSLVPDGIRRPEAVEAARFSVDTHPAKAMKMIGGGELPFGCHGWFKRARIRFWEPHILRSERETGTRQTHDSTA